MPVDLSCIPARAKRQAAPSFKRWVMFLMVLIVAGAGIIVYFWPIRPRLSPAVPTAFRSRYWVWLVWEYRALRII